MADDPSPQMQKVIERMHAFDDVAFKVKASPRFIKVMSALGESLKDRPELVKTLYPLISNTILRDDLRNLAWSVLLEQEKVPAEERKRNNDEMTSAEARTQMQQHLDELKKYSQEMTRAQQQRLRAAMREIDNLALVAEGKKGRSRF